MTTESTQKTSSLRPSSSAGRPPIVAVLGHVDHGKTTLLDTIRKANVAAREHGGITQHIGAHQVAVGTGDQGHETGLITFIDTPGHEAFAKMRSRGATAADIAVLVVAADDSVKPQTIESINQIKAAGIPLIVALNKTDLPTAQPDKVRQDLARHGVQVEGFGGDVPMVPVSGKQGTGIKELLDMIVLVAQMKGLEGKPDAPLEAIVIETRVDKGKGMVASVIIKQGTLKAGDPLFEGATNIAKVRAMNDEYGKGVSAAGPSKPVEVLGFTKLPSVGAILRGQPHEEERKQQSNKVTMQQISEPTELPDWLKPVAEQAKEKLNIILKADTAGSIEAITASLSDQVNVVAQAVGDITEADILLAKSAKAFVVGFNVKAGSAIGRLAQQEKVVYRTYAIIYELLDELTEVVSGMAEVLTGERELGMGVIIAEFPFDGQRIAGTRVTAGRLAKGDTVRIMRGEEEFIRARIKSIRQGKKEVTKAEEGIECGVLFDKKVDFVLQDAIIPITRG